ncbi:MAG: PASTA domain-containing protein [Rikenellaceae bacterium]|nr:PASTA domain-containing protein [Rikenellaceae bacterium]
MGFLKNLIERINGNTIARNLILALCAIIVFFFVVTVLLNLFTRHGQHKTVPDFSGMTVTEAERAGHHGSLRIEVNDSLYVPTYEGGVILEQNPAPGAKVKSGRRIFVTVNSFKQKMVDIPYVTGYSLRQAKNNLEVAGLGIEKLVYRSDMATNNVLEERYDGKAVTAGSKMQAEIGSGITLIVGISEDAAPQAVPKVIGFPLKEAKSRLWEVGLNIGKISYGDGVNALNEKDARVYVQSPGQGRRVTLGTPVDLSITLDEKLVEKNSAASDKAACEEAARQAEEEERTEEAL